jgi:hypothetical protein
MRVRWKIFAVHPGNGRTFPTPVPMSSPGASTRSPDRLIDSPDHDTHKAPTAPRFVARANLAFAPTLPSITALQGCQGCALRDGVKETGTF